MDLNAIANDLNANDLNAIAEAVGFSSSKKRRNLDDFVDNPEMCNEEVIGSEGREEQDLIDCMQNEAKNCGDDNLLEFRGSLGLDGVHTNEKDQLCQKCLEFKTTYQQEKVNLRRKT